MVDEGVESGYVHVDSLTEDYKKKLRKVAKVTECMYNLKERMDDLVHFFDLDGEKFKPNLQRVQKHAHFRVNMIKIKGDCEVLSMPEENFLENW